ncbi:acyl-CoA dehydrogenase family protein [Bacillus sp. 31A1R]|uniref:Acyl-CoA dehydrogenase family protein n=1 Tax=Robertmurraya mangrovi TaxID=3098077 RepID=A0ABU5J2U1_9BACI|nr:acyl-CoA dehydrogenase family protein [Bacillus sp. 31A1R]MDZ5473743.1 acyl-CoA dehydrogenase family protein [Bacillus sp. 31A1R]
MNFLVAKSLQEKLSLMKQLAGRFSERAAEVDEKGSFPFENIKELIESGYTALTIPVSNGGNGLSLFELIKLQETIAIGDGATALSIGWHMGIMKNLDEKRLWDDVIFKYICTEVKKGALINAAASEPQTGSPTRGGKPTTVAMKRNQKWVISGRKTFTTLAPVLDYFIVSASIEGTEEVGNFLIPKESHGVDIEETWDSIAMRGTGSHDLILNHVEVQESYLVEKIAPGDKKANGWLLHIPACYLGIAQAAQNYAIQFAKEYSPNSVKGSIIDLPNVQQKIGEMELLLMQSRHFLYRVAKLWDEANEEERESLKPELGAVKLTVTNSAIKVVDLAMRVVGARSLSIKNPLQRYYRDVRASLHNPPMDDMTIQMLAISAINK